MSIYRKSEKCYKKEILLFILFTEVKWDDGGSMTSNFGGKIISAVGL